MTVTYRLHNLATGEIRETDNLALLERSRNEEWQFSNSPFRLESIGTHELLPASTRATGAFQLSLFGNVLNVIPSSGEAIELDCGLSHCCEDSQSVHTYTRYLGRESVIPQWTRRELDQIGASYSVIQQGSDYNNNPIFHVRVSVALCDSCESVCESCENILGPNSDYCACSNCGVCSDCCECSYCYDCCEMVSETVGCNSAEPHCSDCCECDRCEWCDRYLPSNEYPCERSNYCERCCESRCGCGYPDDEDEYDDDTTDIDRVATFVGDDLFKTGRAFGVELELSAIGISRAASAVRSTGLECWNRGYTHDVSHTDWKALDDGSSGVSAEVVSPILKGEHGLEQLRVVMLALKANGAAVGHGTGTHVHFDCNGMTGKQIASVMRFYSDSADAIDSFMAPSRRDGGDNSYCRRINDWEIDSMDTADTEEKARRQAACVDRYRTVNVQAFYKYGTLEFRQHRGTLNYRKLSAWINFLDALINASLAGVRGDNSLGILLMRLTHYGLTDDNATYLNQRALELAAA